MDMMEDPRPVEGPAPEAMQVVMDPIAADPITSPIMPAAPSMPAMAAMPVEVPPVESQEGQKHMDQPMEVDDSMNSTITASAVGPLPEFQSTNNGFTPEPHHRPQTSYSDTAYSPHYSHANPDAHYNSRFMTSSDADTLPRHGFYNSGKETQMGQSHSRPNSTMGFRTQSESGGSRYQEQSQRNSNTQQEAATKNTSVVIKVGMVGDAQIGKTSLMVKYVEGSWDEDYIQTLGELHVLDALRISITDYGRCQLHGKDHLDSEYRNHLLYMGSWWPARVCQHAATSLQ
jgi:GTP-binding protein of the ras superfamily involved in termination of M-phase